MASLAYQVADRLLKGGVASYIDAQREAGLSYRSIAKALTDKLGISITGETVRRWHNDEAAA